MSGGIYEYFYSRVTQMADDLKASTPLRQAFRTHLRKVAKACRDIEWVDSGDKGPGDEDKAIRECLGEACDYLCLQEAVKEAELASTELTKAITTAKIATAKKVKAK
jgi:hypothetical protein